MNAHGSSGPESATIAHDGRAEHGTVGAAKRDLRVGVNQNASPPAPHSALWHWLPRGLVAVIFVLAAWGKITHPLKFAEEIRAYRMAPVAITNAAAFTVPWIELGAALALLIGPWRLEARTLIALMLVVFTAMKVYVHVNGMHINCGCFGGILGPLEKLLSGFPGILFNFVLLGLCGLDAWLSRRAAPALMARRT